MNSKVLSSKNYCWVVVADESKAIFYTREMRTSPMQEAFVLENSAAREKMSDLISDTGGRAFDSGGQGRHTMVKERSGPRQQAIAAFAKRIAEDLYKGKHSGAYREFAIVAAPRFLGVLRNALASAGKLEPHVTVDKEVVAKEPDFIAKLVDEAWG
jgi:protein required for attachment to host cells